MRYFEDRFTDFRAQKTPRDYGPYNDPFAFQLFDVCRDILTGTVSVSATYDVPTSKLTITISLPNPDEKLLNELSAEGGVVLSIWAEPGHLQLGSIRLSVTLSIIRSPRGSIE